MTNPASSHENESTQNKFHSALTRSLSVLTGSLLLIYAGIVLHDFSAYVDHYPYLAVDDSLGNISYSFGTLGRLGFLSSPIQPFSTVLRHKHYINYGPWYFMLGGVLIWLFGYSVTLLRGIHIGGVFSSAVLSFTWFKGRTSKVAAAVFAGAILHAFDSAHWPMIRPDISVSFFLVLFFIFSGLAIKTEKSVHWFLAGLLAFLSSFAHLIAWTIAPACAVIFFITAWERWRRSTNDQSRRWPIVRSFLAVTLGGFAGLFHFLVMTGFQIRGLFLFLTGYYDSIHQDSPGFTAIISKHLHLAFYYLPRWFNLGLTIVSILAVALVILTLIQRRFNRTLVLTYMLPPAATLVLHLLSRGIYNNYHAGYAIILHTNVFWLIASFIYVILRILEEWKPRWSISLAALGNLALIVLVSRLIVLNLTYPGHQIEQARQWVSISEYLDKIFQPLPRSSTAWGSLQLGIENPDRIQLIQMGEACRLLDRIPPDEWESYIADYLIITGSEAVDFSINEIISGPLIFHVLSRLSPMVHFDLVSLVMGEPYGVTRIYQTSPNSVPYSDSLPLVSVYNPQKKQWGQSVGQALPVQWTPAAPVKIDVHWGSRIASRLADRTLTAKLDSGDYLIQVSLGEPATRPDTSGILTITDTPVVEDLVIRETKTECDTAPYFSSLRGTSLIHQHGEGPIYLSQFDSKQQAFMEDIRVYPIRYLGLNNPIYYEQIPVPPLETWILNATSGSIEPATDGEGITVLGDDTAYGYQLISPPIPIRPSSTVRLHLKLIKHQGYIVTGVLDQSGQWLIPATRLQQETTLNTGRNSEISIVIANANFSPESIVQSRFTLQNVTIEQSQGSAQLYIDRFTDKAYSSNTSTSETKRDSIQEP